MPQESKLDPLLFLVLLCGDVDSVGILVCDSGTQNLVCFIQQPQQIRFHLSLHVLSILAKISQSMDIVINWSKSNDLVLILIKSKAESLFFGTSQ